MTAEAAESTEPTRDQWVTALRSGYYHQGRDRLRDETGHYCALGVFAELHPELVWQGSCYEASDGTLLDQEHLEVWRPSWLTKRQIEAVNFANDDLRWTFVQIADWIDWGGHVDIYAHPVGPDDEGVETNLLRYVCGPA